MSDPERSPERPYLLLICAREPVVGATKTRLGAAIGMEQAATLYRAFLTDLAQRFQALKRDDRAYDLGWAYTPATVDFAAVLCSLGCPPDDDVRFVAQDGEGWGVRQANLLRWGDEHGYAGTVIVASDSPHLPTTDVAAAFDALRDHDVVLGRVHDGGYYLLGVRGRHDVLSGVPMSTGGVADALATRVRDLGLRLAEAPATFDVDEREDLDRLRAELSAGGHGAPSTWHALTTLGLLGS